MLKWVLGAGLLAVLLLSGCSMWQKIDDPLRRPLEQCYHAPATSNALSSVARR